MRDYMPRNPRRTPHHHLVPLVLVLWTRLHSWESKQSCLGLARGANGASGARLSCRVDPRPAPARPRPLSTRPRHARRMSRPLWACQIPSTQRPRRLTRGGRVATQANPAGGSMSLREPATTQHAYTRQTWGGNPRAHASSDSQYLGPVIKSMV